MAKEAATAVADKSEDKDEIKFRPDLDTLANQMDNKWVVGEGGTLTLPAGYFFESAENPDLVNERTYEAVHRHMDLFQNAASLSGARTSVKELKKDPKLQTVTAHAPVWKKDSFEATYKREGTSRNVRTGEVSTYKGSIGAARMNIVSTRTNVEWDNIRKTMRNLAEAAGL